jgi:hypothetical protein
MKKLKHVKLFENFEQMGNESSLYKVEDVCQEGEKVIAYQMEDFVAYGIVSIEDAARISEAVEDLRKYAEANRKDWITSLMRYNEFGVGTSYFTIDANGDYQGHSGTPDPKKFETITYTDGNGEEGEYEEEYLEPMAFTFKRDHITDYRGNGGVYPDDRLDTDSLIENILSNKD